MVRIQFRLAILAILVWSGATPDIQAQTPERRPSGAIFGAPDPRLSGDAQDGGLFLAASGFGAYDDSLDTRRPGQSPAPAGLRLRSRGAYAGFGGFLLYDRPAEEGSLRASLSAAGRYYHGEEQFVLGRQVADLSSSTAIPLWHGARLQATGNARYALNAGPFTNAVFGDDYSPFAMFDGDNALELRRSDWVRGQAQLQQEWGPRKSFVMLVGVQSSGIEGSARAEGYELGGAFNNKIIRYGTFRAGYTLQEIGYGGGNYRIHHIDIGGRYDRPVSSSRRTFVTLGTGSAVLEQRGQVRVRAIADAGLRHQFGRWWNGSARYHRGVIFLDEVGAPLFSDGVVGEVSGLLTRRLEWLGSGSVMRGTTGFSTTSTPYDVYAARTRLQYALSRVVAVHGEYLFLRYGFADSVQLGGRLPPHFDRRTLRVGVTVMTQLH